MSVVAIPRGLVTYSESAESVREFLPRRRCGVRVHGRVVLETFVMSVESNGDGC